MAEDLSDKLRNFKLSDKEEKGLEISEADFETKEDKEKILQGKSWTFDGQYILLKDWKPEAQVFTEEDEKVQIWVQIHNLPLHWLTLELGLKIGGVIGKVVNVQVPSAESSNGHIMKVQVELNLREPIPRGTKIKLGTHNRWVSFRYENLQSFCFYCGLIGHIDKNCHSKKDDLANNVLNMGQYGEWLKVGPSFFSESKSYKSSSSGGGGEGDTDKSSNQVLRLECPRVSAGETSWRGDPVQPNQNSTQRGVDKIGQEGSGSESRIHSDPIDLNVCQSTLETVERESQLVEVEVQPAPMDNRSSSKRRKPILRRLEDNSLKVSANMDVDADGENFESVGVKSVSCL
ncbi:Unknown protein [Striga hermonthica]|uniref:CCHC-type domain-containing protein n=1 Tax=Striga hermonthica TaxID=68872 RepID=A0A9N7N0N0_STRHE|nr:Unknown protein [Striga hermonthica]